MRGRPILLAAFAALAVFLAVVWGKAPSDDRDWQPHLSRTPDIATANGQVRIAPVRDWTYEEKGPVSTDWRDGAEIDPAALKQIWFVSEPHPDIPMMAHTLVLFEFEDGQFLGLTIEARKQTHERYAPIEGAFRRFELIYVWAEPRDLLTRRAVHLEHELYIYPLKLSAEQARAYLEALLERTDALSRKPRFYNTLHSNCTNELAKTAGVGWRLAFVLTGRADRALYDAGLIEGKSFGQAKAAADMTAAVKSLNGLSSAAFNAALLDTLKARVP